jgi:hypothetical protein
MRCLNIVIGSLMFFLFSCSDNTTTKNPALAEKPTAPSIQDLQLAIANAAKQVKDGDLITRAGNDVISASLRNYNKQDKAYSHSGIAFVEDGKVVVYHSYTGAENPDGKMLREPFDSFCSPKGRLGIGIFRYAIDSAEITAFKQAVIGHYKSKVTFDKKFNLADDSELYCSELIAKSMKKATNGRVVIPTTVVKNFKVKDPGLKNKKFKIFEYIAVDNLYMNSFCTEVLRLSFE